MKGAGKYSSVWMLLWVPFLYYFTLLYLTNLGDTEPLMVVDASKGLYVFIGLSVLLLIINYPNYAAYFYIIGLVVFFALVHTKFAKKTYIDNIIRAPLKTLGTHNITSFFLG